MGDGQVLPYLDIPLQHAHPDVLKRMKRPASGEKNLERIQAWRAMNPDLTIRSTFIVGFPGETEAEFEYLLDFLKEAQLDRVGCFAYSPVEGATANLLDNPVPEEVREERRARVMLLQEEISAKRLQAKVGKTHARADRRSGRAAKRIGRSSADAPEIDGVVHIKRPLVPGKSKLVVGEFADVVVTAGRCARPVGQSPSKLSKRHERTSRPDRADPQRLQSPGGVRRLPAGDPPRVDRAVRERGGDAREPVERQDRLHLRPARHADHLHARSASWPRSRAAITACWRPAAWPRSRWSTLRCSKRGDDVLLPDNVYNPNRELGRWLSARLRHHRALLRSDDRRRHRRADPAEHQADLDRGAGLGVDGSARPAGHLPRGARAGRAGRARQHLVGRPGAARLRPWRRHRHAGADQVPVRRLRRADGRRDHARPGAERSPGAGAHAPGPGRESPTMPTWCSAACRR